MIAYVTKVTEVTSKGSKLYIVHHVLKDGETKVSFFRQAEFDKAGLDQTNDVSVLPDDLKEILVEFGTRGEVVSYSEA